MRAGRYCIAIYGECSFRRPETMALSQSISTLIEKTYWAVFAKAFHTTDIASSSIVVSLFIPYFWYSDIGVVVVQMLPLPHHICSTTVGVYPALRIFTTKQ